MSTKPTCTESGCTNVAAYCHHGTKTPHLCAKHAKGRTDTDGRPFVLLAMLCAEPSCHKYRKKGALFGRCADHEPPASGKDVPKISAVLLPAPSAHEEHSIAVIRDRLCAPTPSSKDVSQKGIMSSGHDEQQSATSTREVVPTRNCLVVLAKRATSEKCAQPKSQKEDDEWNSDGDTLMTESEDESDDDSPAKKRRAFGVAEERIASDVALLNQAVPIMQQCKKWQEERLAVRISNEDEIPRDGKHCIIIRDMIRCPNEPRFCFPNNRIPVICSHHAGIVLVPRLGTKFVPIKRFCGNPTCNRRHSRQSNFCYDHQEKRPSLPLSAVFDNARAMTSFQLAPRPPIVSIGPEVPPASIAPVREPVNLGVHGPPVPLVPPVPVPHQGCDSHPQGATGGRESEGRAPMVLNLVTVGYSPSMTSPKERTPREMHSFYCQACGMSNLFQWSQDMQQRAERIVILHRASEGGNSPPMIRAGTATGTCEPAKAQPEGSNSQPSGAQPEAQKVEKKFSVVSPVAIFALQQPASQSEMQFATTAAAPAAADAAPMAAQSPPIKPHVALYCNYCGRVNPIDPTKK